MEYLYQHASCLLVSQAFICGLLAFATTFLLIPLIIKMAFHFNLVDEPNHRKVHKNAIPTLGGIGIILGFLVASIVHSYQSMSMEMMVILGAIFSLCTVGIIDDLKEIPAKYKLVFQLVLSATLCYFGFRIESLGGFLGIYEMPLFAQYGLTMMVMTGFINAFNFIDGIDGLAGGIGAINAALMTFLFILADQSLYAFMSVALLGGLLAFLEYNFNPAKIFMGDTGSTVIGFLLIVFAIKILQIAPTMPEAIFSNALVLVFGALLLPVFDIIRTIIFRVKNGNSPFQPDKTHIHHLLLQTRFDHQKASLTLYAANFILIALALLIKDVVAIEKALFILSIACIFLTEMLNIRRWFNAEFDFKNIQQERRSLNQENKFLTRNLD